MFSELTQLHVESVYEVLFCCFQYYLETSWLLSYRKGFSGLPLKVYIA